MDKELIRPVLMLALFSFLTACAPVGSPPSTDVAQNDDGFTDEYRIGSGDTIRVDVWRNPELSVQVPVRPDGKISVPVAGDVDVGGKTPTAVSEDVKEILSAYIRDPFVTVIVVAMGGADYRARVRVTGAVTSAISVPYSPGMTVLDVVLEAGGPTEFAAPSRTSLYRQSGEKLDVRLDRIMNNGDLRTNYALRPGDVISIPEAIF